MKELREKECATLLYEAPQVEIVEVAVEKGYANSSAYEADPITGEVEDSGTGWWF